MTDKYETLLSAVQALDPFDDDFQIEFTSHSYQCRHCQSSEACTPECPVTILRNVLTQIQSGSDGRVGADKSGDSQPRKYYKGRSPECHTITYATSSALSEFTHSVSIAAPADYEVES